MAKKKATKRKMLSFFGVEIGDYCHCFNYSDKRPTDPYAVGFLQEVSIIGKGIYYKLGGDNVPNRWWQYCEKITEKEGKRLLSRKEI